MLTYQTDPVQAAIDVAAVIVTSPPAKDFIISRDKLLSWAGLVEPPDPCSKKERTAHDLWMVQFLSHLRREVLQRVGRSLETVYGQGLRLVDPNEVVPLAEDEFYTRMLGQASKFSFKVRNVRDSDLTVPERQFKTDASARVGLVAQHLQRARRLFLRNQRP